MVYRSIYRERTMTARSQFALSACGPVLLAFMMVAANVHAMTATRYTLLTGSGTKGGEQVVERDGKGVTVVRFNYKDNGRGPDVVERISQRPDGQIVEYEVKGSSTMGGPVDERFLLQDGLAQWRSPSEQGQVNVAGMVHYVELDGTFELTSLRIGAASARPDGKLALLPSGTLTQTVLATVDLTQPNGLRRQVQLVAHTGISMTPSFFWATVETHPRLFAAIYPGWMSAIEEGYELHSATLAAHQRVAENTMLTALRQRLLQPLRGLTVIRNARIFDSEVGALKAPSDVYIVRGRITAIAPAGSYRRLAPDAEIDAAGRIALPGLFDMHDHFTPWSGGMHLAAGVTTVRDMDSNHLALQQNLDAIADGRLLAAAHCRRCI